MVVRTGTAAEDMTCEMEGACSFSGIGEVSLRRRVVRVAGSGLLLGVLLRVLRRIGLGVSSSAAGLLARSRADRRVGGEDWDMLSSSSDA